MKKNLSTPALVIIAICVLLGCHRGGRHSLDLTVSESGSTYKLQAYYNRNKTGEVQRYLHRQLAPNGFFAGADDYFDAHTQLNDRTKFYIKSAPGILVIKLNKRENSYASYMRIKNMCEGVAGIVKN